MELRLRGDRAQLMTWSGVILCFLVLTITRREEGDWERTVNASCQHGHFGRNSRLAELDGTRSLHHTPMAPRPHAPLALRPWALITTDFLPRSTGHCVLPARPPHPAEHASRSDTAVTKAAAAAFDVSQASTGVNFLADLKKSCYLPSLRVLGSTPGHSQRDVARLPPNLQKARSDRIPAHSSASSTSCRPPPKSLTLVGDLEQRGFECFLYFVWGLLLTTLCGS